MQRRLRPDFPQVPLEGASQSLAMFVLVLVSYEETAACAAGRRWQGLPQTATCGFFVGRPHRAPSPQDLQLETPPEDAVAGNLVIAAHLRLRASLFAG
jgi:hypothetical protein